MSSIQGKLFYGAMKLFYSRMFPPGIPLERLRKGTNGKFEALPRGIRWEESELGGVPGEWITPSTAASDNSAGVLLYLHGGGYIVKSPRIHRVLVGRIALAAGIRAFMVDYQLAPEHPFPAALDDVTAAYRGLLAQGVKPDRIVVAGDSAGGGLTIALLLNLRDSGEPLPAAAGIISGWLDCTMSDGSLAEIQKHDPFIQLQELRTWAQHYSGSHDPRHPLISPLFADLSKLPPILVHAGEHELFLVDARCFVEKAQAAGVNVTLKVWQGMIHDFPVFAGFLPEGRASLKEMAAFFRSHLDREA